MPFNRLPISLPWLALAVFVAACQPEARDKTDNNAAANEARPLPPLPVAEPPMDRAAILLAVARAASAAALGGDDAGDQRRLDGKRFEVRIRFGCPNGARPRASATAPAPPFHIRFDAADRTLRIRATPDLSLDDPRVTSLAPDGVEAVEGFWMYRPWLLADGCPAVPQAPATDTPAPAGGAAEADPQPAAAPPGRTQRVGLAQFFTEADPRTRRRDQRAYESTKVLEADEQPSANGYNLVLSGRLRTLPGGRVINCRVLDVHSPPECVVSAAFDRVWIEVPGAGTPLAEWAS